MVSLQGAVERAEDGGVEDDGQRDGSSSGQEGVDETPARTDSSHILFPVAVVSSEGPNIVY